MIQQEYETDSIEEEEEEEDDEEVEEEKPKRGTRKRAESPPFYPLPHVRSFSWQFTYQCDGSRSDSCCFAGSAPGPADSDPRTGSHLFYIKSCIIFVNF
jgi:hypothetical protein